MADERVQTNLPAERNEKTSTNSKIYVEHIRWEKRSLREVNPDLRTALSPDVSIQSKQKLRA